MIKLNELSKKRLKGKFQNDRVASIFFFTIITLTLFVSLYSNVTPAKLHVDLLSIAQRDIISPITVEDKGATAHVRAEAASAVEDQYTYYEEYASNQVNATADFFELIKKVKDENKVTTEPTDETEESDGKAAPDYEAQLEQVKQQLPSEIKEGLTDDTLLALLKAEPSQLNMAKEITVTAVHDVMSTKIKVGTLEEKKNEVTNKIKYTGLNSALREAMTSSARLFIIPNNLYDPEATADKRNEAKEQVEPVLIRAGEVIVKEGQFITREIYEKLELVGLVDSSVSPLPYVGLASIALLLAGLMTYFFHEFQPVLRDKVTFMTMYVIIFVGTFAIMKLISMFQQLGSYEIGFIIPIAMAAMLIKMLINERIAILTTLIFAIGGSIMFNGGFPASINFSIGVYLLFSGLAGIVFLRKQNHRSRILQAGAFISVVNIVTIASLTLMKYSFYSSMEFGVYGGYGLVSGFLSAVLTLGLMPFFEAGFGMISTMKLIELSNPNHPLLRKVLTEAPGTYHHSVMVANLSEAACEAIGANGLLARVGSYYHDIGKTKRPNFFIENQMNRENPHDTLPPHISKTIIISHAQDGANMLKEYKIPKEIVDIAEQHHGTTLLKFFYHKASSQHEEVLEEDYRYPGPKPQFKEAAIIGVADSIEAAVRSMSNPTMDKIEEMVNNIIKDRILDGQFDECNLTLKELDLAGKSMLETLQGMFHSRIEYPEITEKKVKQA